MRAVAPQKISGARCFRKDLPRIKRLARIISLSENSDVHQEEVITRALSALEDKVKGRPQELASA